MSKKTEMVEMDEGLFVEAHRHSNGGGWVAETAYVSNTVLVEWNAKVYGKARITHKCKVLERARVCGRTTVHTSATISGDAYVADRATVGDNALVTGRATVTDRAVVAGESYIGDDAIVCDNATVNGQARVYGSAIVGGETILGNTCHILGKAKLQFDSNYSILIPQYVSGGKWKQPPLYIQLPIHPIMISRPGYLKIGCEEHSYKDWVEQYRQIATKHGYPEELIKQYHFIIKMLVKSINKGAIPDGRVGKVIRPRYHVPTF